MFKSKKAIAREQEEQLGNDIIACSKRLFELANDHTTTRLEQADIEDAAYCVTIAADLDASPKNWERFQRLVKSWEGSSILEVINSNLDFKEANV